MFYRFSRAVLFWRDFAGEVYCSCALGGAESINFACFRALTSIFMRAGMHRGAALTSGMWIYFRSQVRRCLKTNKQGEFNLLLRKVCRADLKTRTQR